MQRQDDRLAQSMDELKALFLQSRGIKRPPAESTGDMEDQEWLGQPPSLCRKRLHVFKIRGDSLNLVVSILHTSFAQHCMAFCVRCIDHSGLQRGINPHPNCSRLSKRRLAMLIQDIANLQASRVYEASTHAKLFWPSMQSLVTEEVANAQRTSTQKPLGNPPILPLGPCHCTFWISSDVARSHNDMLIAAKCHCFPKVHKGHKYRHRSPDQSRQPDKRSLVGLNFPPFRLHPCRGMRIGEAKYPGPSSPAQCKSTQKPLGNPNVLPSGSCNCTFWTSPDFARSHFGMLLAAKCHCLPKVPEEHKYSHRSSDQLRQPDKRRLAVPIILPFRLHPCHGIRIGEAKHPGPTLPAQCTRTQKPLVHQGTH